MITHTVQEGLYFRIRSTHHAKGRLVFIHGLGESCLCFEKLMMHPALNDWNFLAIDLPGYGKTPWPEKPLSLDDQAALLMTTMKLYGNEKHVIIGHSMGGVIGQLFCEKYCECLDGFVNVEGNLTPGDCVFSGQAASQPEDGFIKNGFDVLREKIFEDGMYDKAQRGYYASLKLANPAQFYRNSRELVDFSSLLTAHFRFKTLALPKLYIAGIPRGICQKSLAFLQSNAIQMAGIPDSGHWPFLDQPDLFCQQLMPFLNQF